MNRWQKLKRMGCIKSVNGRQVIDQKRLELETGYIPPFREDLENAYVFCLSCGALHRHGGICPYCESDAQEEL